MSAILLNSQADAVTAALGNANDAVVTVSVLAADGTIGTGLGIGDFTVYTRVQAPGGAGLQINNVVEGGDPGFYNIHLIPMGGTNWQNGTYIVGIKVERGNKIGFTVAKFEVT